MEKEGRTNYTHYEKELLLSLVKSKPILTEKCTNKFTNEGKERAWREICSQFSRDPKARLIEEDGWTKLRSAYKNMKAKAGKEIATARRERMKTGGGQMNADDISTLSQKVQSIEPNQFEPLAANTDSELFTLPLLMQAPAQDESFTQLLDDSVLLNDSVTSIPHATNLRAYSVEAVSSTPLPSHVVSTNLKETMQQPVDSIPSILGLKRKLKKEETDEEKKKRCDLYDLWKENLYLQNAKLRKQLELLDMDILERKQKL